MEGIIISYVDICQKGFASYHIEKCCYLLIVLAVISDSYNTQTQEKIFEI
jgi:hypothetical protein